LRLKFLRRGEIFGIICSVDQLLKMERVVHHNGGRAEVLLKQGDALYVKVLKT
jgi:hypothetical protein